MVPLVMLLLAVFAPPARSMTPPENQVWPRPVVLPKPVATTGVVHPVISLGGTWKLNVDPPADFWSNSTDPASWIDTQVPGQLQAQGIVTKRKEVAFRTKISVPADYAGKRIFLRFEGVTGRARVWVNGSFIRDHFGGFTVWNCDITDQVAAGKEALLTVGMSENSEGVSSFNVGGMLRDIKLIAVPQDYVARLNIETDFDRDYRDAVLKVWVAVDFHKGENARVSLRMMDPQGKAVPLKSASMDFSSGAPETIAEIPVPAPIKWDAEHPNL
jgi:beta-galactosidase/beta-glucuronidase